MNKDDEADMADRVMIAKDWAAMWAHIAVEAQSNPTYAIAYAILMLGDKVEDLANALEAGCDKIASAIDNISSAMNYPPDKS